VLVKGGVRDVPPPPMTPLESNANPSLRPAPVLGAFEPLTACVRAGRAAAGPDGRRPLSPECGGLRAVECRGVLRRGSRRALARRGFRGRFDRGDRDAAGYATVSLHRPRSHWDIREWRS
jgi:hypothetical protein